MLEIMTVVVIALFIGMLAGPALVRRMPEYRLDGAVSAAVGELRAARMAAISEGRPVTAEVDSGGGVMTLKTDRNENGTYEASEQVQLRMSHWPGISITSSVPQGVFGPRGMFVSSAGSWTLSFFTPGGTREYVYVFASGHVERSKVPLQ